MEGKNQQVMVSICCLAYNHEQYIRSALESFVTQKTNFAFEVLIHDDASTDGTAAIIREYEEKYPELVRPIYQTENQYSKGISVSGTYQYPRARGKYLAICEGDDYWIDVNKLQHQVDFLEAHPEYSLCVHNTLEHNCIDGTERWFNPLKEEKDLSLISIMECGGAQFHTSSMMFKRELALQFPDYCSKYGFGDYPKSIFLALNGKVRYFPEVMSVYRLMTAGSWTDQNEGSGFSREKAVKRTEALKAILDAVDESSNGIYHEDILRIKRSHDFSLAVRCGDYKYAMRNYPDLFRKYPLKTKLSLLYRAYLPGVRRTVRKIMGKGNQNQQK